MLGVRVGDAVYDPETGHRWSYSSLEWWQGACTGLDYAGHRTRATIDGDRLMVQHGDNPEAVRWFTLDELNHVDSSWSDGDIVLRWCEQIHDTGRQ
jgi:hypothetical protein